MRMRMRARPPVGNFMIHPLFRVGGDFTGEPLGITTPSRNGPRPGPDAAAGAVAARASRAGGCPVGGVSDCVRQQPAAVWWASRDVCRRRVVNG